MSDSGREASSADRSVASTALTVPGRACATVLAMYPGTFAAETPDQAAIIMGGSGQVVTYRQLHEEACRVAQLLRAAGLRAGDHMAFCLENHPRFMAIA